MKKTFIRTNLKGSSDFDAIVHENGNGVYVFISGQQDPQDKGRRLNLCQKFEQRP